MKAEDLEKACKQGEIRIADFVELLSMRPRRTHLLKAGDYVVLSPVIGRRDILKIEEIARLDSPESGDFETVRGTTGPINGNVFIKIDKPGFPRYLLIEGDRIGESGCPTPVYDVINEYSETMSTRH